LDSRSPSVIPWVQASFPTLCLLLQQIIRQVRVILFLDALQEFSMAKDLSRPQYL
jgi:hypothetical protein